MVTRNPHPRFVETRYDESAILCNCGGVCNIRVRMFDIIGKVSGKGVANGMSVGNENNSHGNTLY